MEKKNERRKDKMLREGRITKSSIKILYSRNKKIKIKRNTIELRTTYRFELSTVLYFSLSMRVSVFISFGVSKR